MMTRYIALLRAVNVGGTGKLPMATLRSMCVDAGFSHVETYIASGNVMFESNDSSAEIKTALETRLFRHVNKAVEVMVRTTKEMAAVLSANPFRDTQPNHTYVIFLDHRPPRDALRHAVGRVHEQMHLGEREIFVAYPNGMGRSKLKIPAAKTGTARNLNTVSKLIEMASRKSRPP